MKRVYFWKGQRYPSVTSILDVIAKPALVNWATHQVAEFAANNPDDLIRLAKVPPPGPSIR